MKPIALMLGGAILLLGVLGLTYSPRNCTTIHALPWLRCELVTAHAK